MRRGILADREMLQGLRGRISQKPFAEFYDVLVKRCGLILQSTPMTEMNWQAAWANGCQNSALTAARGAQGRIFDLVIADSIDTNQAYRSRAVEELLNLVNWSTWIDPSRTTLIVDLCTAEAALAVVVGLDWLWDELDEKQRDKIIATLRQRVLDPYCKSVEEDVWWYTAVNHWNAVINSACGLTAIALDGHAEESQKVHELSRAGLQHFFNDLGREGGWDEGLGYWGYAMHYVLLFGEACMRLIDDRKLLHHRGMDSTGLFPIYFSPNGKPASFGDSAKVPLHGALYLLAKYFGQNELTWWLDTYSFKHDVSTTEWSQAGLALLFHPELDGPPAPPELEPVKVFHQIGWAAMADAWPRPGFYAAVKTGDLATSHSQHDMNSLQLQVDGEMMLVDIGHPPDEGSAYFSLERSGFYEIQARAHNTVIVAEEDHMPNAQGSICESRSDKDYRWVVCDAKDACGESVKFYRHVLMVLDPQTGSGQALVVLDELNLGSPERVDLFWHTGGEVKLDEKKLTGRITGHRAQLDFALAATVPCEATCGTQGLDNSRSDQYIRLSGGMIGPQFFASVFSQEPLTAELEIIQNESGGLQLLLGKTALQFDPGRGYLNFGGIVRLK